MTSSRPGVLPPPPPFSPAAYSAWLATWPPDDTVRAITRAVAALPPGWNAAGAGRLPGDILNGPASVPYTGSYNGSYSGGAAPPTVVNVTVNGFVGSESALMTHISQGLANSIRGR